MLAEVLPKMEAALKNLEARLEARGGQFMAGNPIIWSYLKHEGLGYFHTFLLYLYTVCQYIHCPNGNFL